MKTQDHVTSVVLSESVNNEGLRTVTATGLKAGFLNKNSRIYTKKATASAVTDAVRRINNGEQILSIAPANSPLEKEHTAETKYFNVNVNWNEIGFDSKTDLINLSGTVIPTEAGEKLLSVLESGVKLGVSMVSEVLQATPQKKDIRTGRAIVEVEEFRILRFDVVLNQSDSNAKITALESDFDQMEDVTPTIKEAAATEDSVVSLAQQKRENEELQRKIAEYQQNEERQKIKDFLCEEEAKWSYPSESKSRLRAKIEESIAELGAGATIAKVKDVCFKEKNYTESILSATEMRMRNAVTSQGGLLYGFAVENTPQHAVLSSVLMESAVKHGSAYEFGRNGSNSRSENLAQQCLNLFDLRYRNALLRESRVYQEATSLEDVPGIYSAARFILAQGYAQSKAANVFDVQALGADAAPVASWVELSNDNNQLQQTVAAEVIASAKLALNTPYKLANKNIIFDLTTLVVTGGGTFGTDHVVDTNNGTYTPLTATGLAATSIAYQYKNFSPGEGIISMRRAITHQVQLAFKHITLGYNITREALISSKQSYGNEHQMAVLNAITQELVIEKDTQLFNMAVAKAGTGAGNLVGTFHTATDSPLVLATLIGDALGKLEGPGRNLTATAIVMGSALMGTFAQYMSNRTAPPLNGTVLENGYVSMFNGVPVHRVNTMPSNLILVLDRELVLDRIKSPVTFVVSDVPGIGYNPTGNLLGTGPSVGYTATSTSILAEESCSVATISNKAAYISVV